MAWSMEHGAGSMGLGAWSMEHGAGSMGLGASGKRVSMRDKENGSFKPGSNVQIVQPVQKVP